MAEVVTDYSFTDAKVHKVLLTKHEEFPELLFTRYKLECWGATGGTDNIGRDEKYYQAAGYTQINGKKGDYVCTYLEIGHDTEIYISVGTPGMENNSGGWYGQTGSVRAGGSTSISLLGTDGSTTPDYSKMIIRAKGGDSGTYIVRSNPQKVYDDKFRVSTLSDSCFAPGKRTISDSYFTSVKSNQVKHDGVYEVWKDSKHSAHKTSVSWKVQNIDLKGLTCVNSSNIGRWMIVAMFSVWTHLDTSNNPRGELTWNATKEITVAIGITSNYVTLQDGPEGGTKAQSGTIRWSLEADMNYCLYVKLDSLDKVDVVFSVKPWGTGGHSHLPTRTGSGCSDIITTYHWEYEYSLYPIRQCTHGNYVVPANTYDTSITSLATPPNNDTCGYVRITRCNPMYRVNNINNDDYRNLLIGRPMVGRDHMDDMFQRDLTVMRKDKWSEDLEYKIQIINGFASDQFEYLGTYISQNGGYDCLIDIDNTVEEFIEIEPGIYEYYFPKEGIYLFECWGAAGGHSEHENDNENSICGYGGYVAGICYINKDIEKATIYVGGQGTMTSPSVPHVEGGFNGGSGADRPYDLDVEVGSGGGATDIRIGGTSLNDRILVAGGGAGQGPLDQYKYGHVGGKSTNYISSELINESLIPAYNIVPDYNPIKALLDSSVVNIFTDDLFENCYNCNGTGTVMVPAYPVYSYSASGSSTLTLQPGIYKLECWGAEGGGSRVSGNSNSGLGGKGGYSVGTITLEEETTLYIYVGGLGGSSNSGRASGGYNGGGSGYGSSSSEPGNGGGGASDIRINSTSLYARVIVAGGGGGGGEDAGDAYGHGGGETGIDGESGKSSSNGTQTSAGTNGTFGQGGSTNYGDGGGGGGGWYGGGTTSSSSTGTDTQGGGGGSGYVYTEQSASNYPSGCLLNDKYYLTDASTINGTSLFPSPTGSTETGHIGNGYVKISTISTVYVPDTCPICEGTKRHLDENKTDDILAAINNYYPDYSGYNKVVNSPSNCIATQTSAGILGGFGYANSVSQQTFREFTINESIIKGYIDQACADIPSYTNLTSYIGSWTTELLSKYLINCSYCNGEGRYVTGYTYTWKTDLSSSKIYSSPSSSSRYCYYCTQTSCEWYGYYTFSSESNYDYYGTSGQVYYGTPGGHEKHGWYRRSQYDAYQVISGTKYATCPTCNGTKQHYDPEQKDAIYNDIIEYIGNELNEYDATMIPITSPAISTYPVYVKGPGAGGGWYGGGVLRDKKNFIAAGGGSNYVYSESSKPQYPGTKPDNLLFMVNTQSVSGLTYQPMINSYLNMRFGSTGDGAVRIRKLSTKKVEPQSINLISNISEVRDV